VPRFVFVVTYGRSGSTLTQGLLNTLPGALVRGEHDFYLLHYYRAWANVRDFKRRYGQGIAQRGAQSAFYGLNEVDLDAFVDTARDVAMKQLRGRSSRDDIELLGFKEVLWYRIRPRETADFFRFFERIFPDALYVLHRRDHEQVATSGFWRRQGAEHVDRSLSRVEDIQDFLRRTRPERTVDTQYENYTSSDPKVVDEELRRLAKFVTGECDEQLLTQLRGTLAVGHGPNPFGKSRERPMRRRLGETVTSAAPVTAGRPRLAQTSTVRSWRHRLGRLKARLRRRLTALRAK
jgi:hypothetical protein